MFNEISKIVWEGFLTAELQDENWHDEDTARLISQSILSYIVSRKKKYLEELKEMIEEQNYSLTQQGIRLSVEKAEEML